MLQLPSGNYKQVSPLIYVYQANKLQEIATKERLDIDSLFRYFIEIYINRYIHDHSEIREQSRCNKCGHEHPRRKMHLVILGYDEFKFCDSCFFSGGYKVFINQMI